MGYKAIFLVLATITLTVNAQMNCVYTLNEKNNNEISINVYFYMSGDYEINMEEIVSNDIIYEYILSAGKYFLENNQIVCRDFFNGYETIFSIENESITPTLSFGFIKYKNFIRSSFQIHGEPTLKSFKINKLSTIKNKYKSLLPDDIEFQIGEYKNPIGFTLELNKDNKYRLTFKNIIISNGKWYICNKEIILYDCSLKHSFYAVKVNNELINYIFPWDIKFLRYLKIAHIPHSSIYQQLT